MEQIQKNALWIKKIWKTKRRIYNPIKEAYLQPYQRGVFTILSNIYYVNFRDTAQKMKKSLMQNFMFCAV